MAEFKCVPLDDLVMVLLFFWCVVFVAANLVIFRQNFSATMVPVAKNTATQKAFADTDDDKQTS